jgi:hypothetical protein
MVVVPVENVAGQQMFSTCLSEREKTMRAAGIGIPKIPKSSTPKNPIIIFQT